MTVIFAKSANSPITARLSPDAVSEQQLRRYFLYLKNEKHYADGSLRVTFSGIQVLLSRHLPA